MYSEKAILPALMNMYSKESENPTIRSIKVFLKCRGAVAYVAAHYQLDDFISPFKTSLSSKGKILSYYLSAFVSIFPNFIETLRMNNSSSLFCQKYSLVIDKNEFTSYKKINIRCVVDEIFIFLAFISKKYNEKYAEAWIKRHVTLLRKHSQSPDNNIPKRGKTAKLISDFWADNPNFRALVLKYFIQYKFDRSCKFTVALIRNVKMVLAWADQRVYYESYKYVKYGYPLLNLNPMFLDQVVFLVNTFCKDRETEEKKELQPYLTGLGLLRPEHDVSFFPDVAYAAMRYFKKKNPRKSSLPEPFYECKLEKSFLNKYYNECIKFEFRSPLPTIENLEMVAGLGMLNNFFNLYRPLFEKHGDISEIMSDQSKTLMLSVEINPFAYILAVLNHGTKDELLAHKMILIRNKKCSLPSLTVFTQEHPHRQLPSWTPVCSRRPLFSGEPRSYFVGQ